MWSFNTSRGCVLPVQRNVCIQHINKHLEMLFYVTYIWNFFIILSFCKQPTETWCLNCMLMIFLFTTLYNLIFVLISGKMYVLCIILRTSDRATIYFHYWWQCIWVKVRLKSLKLRINSWPCSFTRTSPNCDDALFYIILSGNVFFLLISWKLSCPKG